MMMKMRATRLVASGAAIGNMLNGWDSATLAGALLYIIPEFGLDTRTILEGFIVAASLVGAAISTTFAGPGADRLGRRPILCISATLYCIAALLMLCSPNVYFLVVARVIDGVGVGLAVTTAPLYISEVSPAEIRGELNTLPQLLGTSGVFLAYCMVFFISLTTDPSWRLMLGVMFVPSAIYLAITCFFLPESPRWLVSKGRTREAKQVLQRLRNKEDVSGEMALLVEGLDVGEDPALEGYIIEPAENLMKDFDEENLMGGGDEEPHLKIVAPNGEAQFIAKPMSSRASSHGLILSRPTSVSHQLTSLGSFPNFTDPMVGFIGSLKGSFVDHRRQVELEEEDNVEEHAIRRRHEEDLLHGHDSGNAGADYVGGGLTSPLLVTSRARHSNENLDILDPTLGIRSPGTISGQQHISNCIVGSVSSADIGGGWHVGWMWSDSNETSEGHIPSGQAGSYKKVFMLENYHGDGSHVSESWRHGPGHEEEREADQSFPAVAIVSRPSQYGSAKDFAVENQVIGPAVVHPAESARRRPSWSELFEGGVREALFVGVTLQILEQFGGINAVLNFAPEILQESGADVLLSSMGIGSESASILASAATQLLAIPFILVSMRLMDVVGRRKILLITIPILVLALACLIIISVVPTSDAVFSSVSFVSFVVYVVFFVTGFGPIPNMLCAEIFPTRVRGICIGICQAAMWVTNILVTELFPSLDATLGTAMTFAFFAFFCIVAWIFVYVKVPETKGLPLEVIVEIFSIRAADRKKSTAAKNRCSNETDKKAEM